MAFVLVVETIVLVGLVVEDDDSSDVNETVTISEVDGLEVLTSSDSVISSTAVVDLLVLASTVGSFSSVVNIKGSCVVVESCREVGSGGSVDWGEN